MPPTLNMQDSTTHQPTSSVLSPKSKAFVMGEGGKVSGGKEVKLDPRTIREFKPSSSPIPIIDGPPKHSVINFLSSDCVTISDLNWWTCDQHIAEAAAAAGVMLDIEDITFTEHKVNGKSKGSVTVNCRSPERASMLVHWFHCNEFQGKYMPATYVTNGMTPKPTGKFWYAVESFNNARPAAGANVAAPFATNAHGGINFNRLRPHYRQQPPPLVNPMQHGNIGMGYPSNPKGLFGKLAAGKVVIQDGMQYGCNPDYYPQNNSWGGLQSSYPTYASVDRDLPANNPHGVTGGYLYSDRLSYQ